MKTVMTTELTQDLKESLEVERGNAELSQHQTLAKIYLWEKILEHWVFEYYIAAWDETNFWFKEF